jgi:hypothetical protein
MSFKQFIKELNGDRAEGNLLRIITFSVLSSLIVFFVLYSFIFKNVYGFLGKFGPAVFFSILSYAILIPAMYQVKTYKKLPCMSGMMVGMTLGMISGFLIGFFVASTNGMFYGGVFGMVVGIILGVVTGRASGIMGVMEGMMAGLMGGWMGAMTSIMLLNDHLFAAGIIIFVVSLIIMVGLNYMIYKEMKDAKISQASLIGLICVNLVLSVLTILMIVYGPRGGLLA